MMQPVTQGTNVLDEMDDMLGQISSIGSNQFTMSFVQCMPSMTITTDTNTAFIGFDAIGKSNSFRVSPKVRLYWLGCSSSPGELYTPKRCDLRAMPHKSWTA